MEILFQLVGYVVYVAMALLALWGAFCVVMVWRRISQTRFRDEDELDDFFEEFDEPLLKGKYEAAVELCEDDRRAMPQLAIYAVENRDLRPNRLQRQLVERFQQDVLSDIEHRLSWISTVIKSAPMIGLFGTVVGMMGAFANLSKGTTPDSQQMAADIMFALITTACGLAIAVPLILASNSIAVQLRKMEDLVANGLSRLMDSISAAIGRG